MVLWDIPSVMQVPEKGFALGPLGVCGDIPSGPSTRFVRMFRVCWCSRGSEKGHESFRFI